MSWAVLWRDNPARLYELAKDAPRLPPVVRLWVREWEARQR